MSRHTGFQSLGCTIGSALAVVSALQIGCSTDEFFSRNDSPEGPITSMENPRGVDVPDINIADAREVDLVESVLSYRAQYVRTLHVLRDYYVDHGYDTKRRWAEHEMADVAKIKPYAYILEAEVPSQPISPTDSVAAADELYEQAVKTMKQGGHGTPLFYREETMKKALAMFKELIRKYPNSDKIDDAAFYCGEIHKEYFKDEEAIAVKWYEKALEWNPNTPHPVRFQAAVLYDLRLHDRDRALELYKGVLDKEEMSRSNRRFAANRIHELTREKAGEQDAALASASETTNSAPDPDETLTPSEADVRANEAEAGRNTDKARPEVP